MSRSRRKTPIFGNTTEDSDKDYKRFEHRRERAKAKQALLAGEELLPDPKEFGNPWNSRKDGKSYWPTKEPKWFRK
jgi:hypothetical protein